ncbi:MAG: aminotransferase class I/II-fold pyridoxal phosphate-dependent enzyme [Candidatus Nanopelagicales bacterium]
MTDRLVRRMRGQETSVFGTMSAIATATGALNLGQGFPDTDGPAFVQEAALEAIRTGKGAQYPPAHGVPELRAAVCRHQAANYGLNWDPGTDVVVATGASEAIAASVMALVEPGEEVLVLEPWFDLYDAVISLAGARRVAVPPGPNFRPDPDAISAAVTPATKMLIVNSPHNPTGVVWTASEVAAVARIAVDHDLRVLADDAYEHLWYQDHRHIPIATQPGMAERTITVGSAGKSFSFTGWKVGWATGPADLIAAVRVVRQHLSYVSGGPFQYAIAAALDWAGQEYWEGLQTSLSAKRDLLTAGLTDLGMAVIPGEGTYYLCSDVRPLGYDSGLKFCAELPSRAGVVAIPVAALGSDPRLAPWVRWAYCKQEEILESALGRLRRAFPA